MKKLIFIWALILILLSSISVGSQSVSVDTSQTESLKLQEDLDGLKMEFEKVKSEGYEKAIEGANRSIFISTLVVIFVTLLAIAVGIFGYFRIRDIQTDYKETKAELRKSFEDELERVKEYKNEIKAICDEIKEKGKFVDEETENFKKRISAQREEVPADFSKEVSKLAKKDSKTAIQEYEKVMNEIFDEEIYSTMAYNYYSEGKYEDCIAELKKVIRVNPQSHVAYYNWGAALGKLDRHEEAIEKCKKATDLKPNYASGWYNIACIHSLQKNKEGALKNLKKAIELDPSSKEDAKKEEDFKNLWEDEDFKKLVE